jgi:hypothetical protein
MLLQKIGALDQGGQRLCDHLHFCRTRILRANIPVPIIPLISNQEDAGIGKGVASPGRIAQAPR